MGVRPNTRTIGAMGEKVCANYLGRYGYKVLCTNWYCRWGEIDIIAAKNGKLIFVEVKTVTAKNYCTAKDLFHPAKRRKLLRTILLFLARQYTNSINWELDLVCVTKDGRKIWIDHYKNVLAL